MAEKKNIFETINAVMEDVGAIGKDKKNQQQGFMYRGIDDVMNALTTYVFMYFFVFLGSMLIVSLDRFDFTTNFTAVATTFNNVGPGLNEVGPLSNFSMYSPLSKLVMIFDMLAGRLELFPMLVLFAPGTWKKN